MNDFITGEQFISLANNKDIFYTHTHEVNMLLSNPPANDFILITHNSDDEINEHIDLPDNLIHWFAQNVNIINDRIESLPIGLENSKWFPMLHKKELLENQLQQKKSIRNLVYMNHNCGTNLCERLQLYKMFEGKHWVTAHRGSNGVHFDKYLVNLYNHCFMICPRGNGIDTVRLWETLYLKTIPIVKRCINVSFYEDLPICFVDDWEEVTEGFLRSEYIRISTSEWNLDKLKFSYWKNKILNYHES